MASKNPKNSGTIRIWSNDATDILIDLLSEETIQFGLENIKASKETREVYNTLQASNTFSLIQFEHTSWKIVRFPVCWSMPETNLNRKFESQMLQRKP